MDDLPPIILKSRQPTIDLLMMGGAPLGSLFREVPVEQARATVVRALELGINKFDTAPLYGLGLSETIFGDVLSEREHTFEMWTKVGRILVPSKSVVEGQEVDVGHQIYKVKTDLVPVFDFSAAAVRMSADASRERLRCPIVGLRLHDADTDKRFTAAMAIDGGLQELVAMRERGEIKYVSAGLNDPAMLIQFARHAPRGTFDNFMCAGSWNLLDQSGYGLLRTCQETGIKVTNAGIFGSGILWGGAHLRYAQASPVALAAVVQWEQLCKEYRLPLPAVALAFALLPAVVENVAIGVKAPEEIDTNVALLQYSVPPQLWADAQNRGLLPSWLPMPSESIMAPKLDDLRE